MRKKLTLTLNLLFTLTLNPQSKDRCYVHNDVYAFRPLPMYNGKMSIDVFMVQLVCVYLYRPIFFAI